MKKILFVVSFFMLAAGCMKDEDNNLVEKSYILSVVPILNGYADTRALWIEDDIELYPVGVQVTNFAGTSLYIPEAKNIMLSNSGAWKLSVPVCLSFSKAKIYAYSPYSDTEGDFTGTGETAQRLLDIPPSRKMTEQIDYLYAAQDKHILPGGSDINNENPNVTLTLNHALAQIAFVIYQEDFHGTGALTDLSIKDNAGSSALRVNKTGTNDLKMMLSDGTILHGEASALLTVSSVGSLITETTDPGEDVSLLKTKINGYALVVPATFSDRSTVEFTFMIDDSPYGVSLPGSEMLSWDKGNLYIYKIKLAATEMTLMSVTITEWTSGYGGEIIIR